MKLTLGDIEYPAKNEVCSRCRGTGTHVNPAIDGNGLSSDDIDELGGADFMEDYLGGVYDVRCEECNGEKVVKVLDEDRATPDQIAEYYDYLQEEANYRAEVAAERRMGA